MKDNYILKSLYIIGKCSENSEQALHINKEFRKKESISHKKIKLQKR